MPGAPTHKQAIIDSHIEDKVMHIAKWPRPYHACDAEPAHFAVEDYLDRTIKFNGLLLDEAPSLLD
jgi:hypothetical protein